MNLKSLFASIGVLFSSVFAPINVSAAEKGDLVQLLEPSIEFDYFTILDTSDTAYPVMYAEFPNAWDVTGQSGTGQPNYSNSMGIAPMSSIGSSNSTNSIVTYVSKLATYSEEITGKYNVNIAFRPGTLYQTSNDTYSFGWRPVDFIFSGKDIVVSSLDIASDFNLSVKHSSNANQNYSIDYLVTGTIRDLVYSGNDYAISDFAFSRSGSFSLESDGNTSVNPFTSLGNGDFGNFIWFSDLKIQIGISNTDSSYGYVDRIEINMPYYTSSVIANYSSLKQWLISKGIYDSDIGSNEPCVCPPCEQEFNIVDLVAWIPGVLSVFFNFNIFPNFNLGDVFSVVIFVLFVVAILRIIAGG